MFRGIELILLTDLMIAMQLLGDPPKEVVILGVQPQSTDWSADLTAPVRDSMDGLLTLVIRQLKSWTAPAALR